MQQRWFGSIPDSTFRTVLCRCSFLIKYVKYVSMVNKKLRIYIYIYNVCVCVREREKEYGKKETIMPVISKWRLIINPTLKSALLFPSWSTNQSQSSKDCVIASNGPRLLTKIKVFTLSSLRVALRLVLNHLNSYLKMFKLNKELSKMILRIFKNTGPDV